MFSKLWHVCATMSSQDTAATPSTPAPDFHPSAPRPQPSPSLLLNPAFHACTAVASCAPLAPGQPPPASGEFFEGLKALTDAISAGDYQHPEALAASQAT